VETLGNLAALIDAEVVGDPGLAISGVAGLDTAREGDIVFAEDERTLQVALGSPASAVIVGKSVGESRKPLLKTSDPKYAFSRLLYHFHPPRRPAPGVHPTAVVSEAAELGRDAAIGPNVVIEDGVRIGDRCVVNAGCFLGRNVVLGPDCLLYPGVTIYHECVLGARVAIHSGTVIGGDGFGYVCHEGKQEKLLQVGNVVIGDDVEIGCNTCVDRASFGSTRIGRGTKIDNHVQIGHNAELGEDCIVVSQVGISGSVKIGNGCILAGQVGVADHAVLEDRVIVGAQSGVPRGKRIRSGQVVLGSPARNADEFKKTWAVIASLPDFAIRFRELEAEVARLRSQAEAAGQAQKPP
jgi:UDP-3-O-[3-hydroxymyristoyl] glucosamine N-acyltransferase